MKGISLNQSCERNAWTKVTFPQNCLSHVKFISKSGYFPQVLGTSLDLENENVLVKNISLELDLPMLGLPAPPYPILKKKPKAITNLRIEEIQPFYTEHSSF